MEEKPVVTCFLRHRGEVLLLRRSGDVGSYRSRWGGVSGHVETGDPVQDARREIDEETGLGGAVTLVRRGESFAVEDEALGTRWLVHPVLFDCAHRDLHLDWESTEAAWVKPTDILRRETVPELWTSYARVAPSLASIRDDTAHGAAWLSLRALETLRDAAGLMAHQEAAGAWGALGDLARQLCVARPSMTVIANRINRAMHAARETATAEAVENAAHEAIGQALEADAEAARCAAGFVAGRRVFTLSRSGTVLDALRQADPTPERIILAVSEPGREGVAVAEELAKAGINVMLVADAAIGQVFAEGKVDVVLVGADTVLRNGAVVNKVGTRLAALAARQHLLPFYAVAAIDKIRTDDDVPLEEADASTLYDGEAPIEVFNPLFEVTPGSWLSGLITEEGILAAVDVQDVAFELEALKDW